MNDKYIHQCTISAERVYLSQRPIHSAVTQFYLAAEHSSSYKFVKIGFCQTISIYQTSDGRTKCLSSSIKYSYDTSLSTWYCVVEFLAVIVVLVLSTKQINVRYVNIQL